MTDDSGANVEKSIKSKPKLAAPDFPDFSKLSEEISSTFKKIFSKWSWRHSVLVFGVSWKLGQILFLVYLNFFHTEE